MSVWADALWFVAAWAAAVGPVVLAIVLLNRRDDRAEALRNRVAEALPAEALRSDVGVQVRVGVVSRRAMVRLVLGSWSPATLWETITRLRGQLPPAVRLVVEGQDARLDPVRITVECPAGASLRRAA